MSYCRFSSEDWSCDVYCYEAEHAWITHVAGNRIVGEVPKIDLTLTGDDANKLFCEQYEKQMTYLGNALRENIDLPFAGHSFEDCSLIAMRSRLFYLKELGYRVPDRVFERIDSEIKEEAE